MSSALVKDFSFVYILLCLCFFEKFFWAGAKNNCVIEGKCFFFIEWHTNFSLETAHTSQKGQAKMSLNVVQF